MFLFFIIIVSLEFELELWQPTDFLKDIYGHNQCGRDSFFILCLDDFISHVLEHFDGTGSHGMG